MSSITNIIKDRIENILDEEGIPVRVLPRSSSEPEAQLLRVLDIPGDSEALTATRRYNWFKLNVDREVAKRQSTFVNNNPTSHMKKLIDFINDYLDKHKLADTVENQKRARDFFYLSKG